MLSLQRVFSLARLVFIDGVKRHALQGVILLALAVELSGLFFFAFVPRDIGRVSADFVLTSGWGAGMIFLFFHAVQVMSWGENKRTIHSILAHPISRSEYVTGVFVGLLCLLVVLDLSLGVTGYIVLLIIKSWVAEIYFSDLSIYGYALSWLGIIDIQIIILSAIVLFSGMLRGGFAVFLVTLSYYFICNGVAVAREFFHDGSVFADNFLKFLTIFFPSFFSYNYKESVLSIGAYPETFDLIVQSAYVFLYCLILLICSSKVYSRRDLQ